MSIVPMQIGAVRPYAPRGIVIHCSASAWRLNPSRRVIGRAVIDKWHRERGWDGIGYHWVVTCLGESQPGRAENRMGAHARGHNDWLGVCVVGSAEHGFSESSLVNMAELVASRMLKYSIEADQVRGHCEFPGVNKTCPDFNMDELRRALQRKTERRMCEP